MTAILAIFNRTGQPVAPAELDAMLAATPCRGRDGQDTWVEGNVALAHQHFWVTPEEIGERQPLRDPSRPVVVTCDARLDNRSELIAALGLDAATGRDSSDAQLLLHAYGRWGAGCVSHLLGAFAFAVWDAGKQHLFLAQDATGERSLCYYLDRDRCLVASEIAAILAHPAVRPRLNEGKVGEFLDGQWPIEEETFYEGIRYCPPAHCLLVSADSDHLRRYWDVDPQARLRYARHEEYVEHFRALLAEAVRCRLRSAGPVGISLSGGLDSLSVAAMAAHLLSQTGYPAGRLQSYSYVFDELVTCDERRYIEPVVDQCAVDATFIPADGLWTLRDPDRWPVYRSMPAQDPGVWLSIAVLAAAQSTGCRVMLSGLFGDELFEGGQYWAAGMLAERRFAGMLPYLTGRMPGVKWRQDILTHGLRPLIPASVRQVYRQLRPRPVAWFHPGLHPAFIARAGLEERSRRHDACGAFTAPGKWQHYRVMMHGGVSESTAALRELSSPFGVEYAHPFVDRRLIEFAMAVPADELSRPGRSKRMMRDAMAGLMPDSARERIGKTSLVPLIEKGLLVEERAAVREILSNPQIVEMEFVRAGWLAAELDAGSGWSADGYFLWLCLSLELWLSRYW